MDTLCVDLSKLVYNHTDSYETILLGFQLKDEDFDMKWFIYNLKHRQTHGLDILGLARKHGLSFIKLLQEIFGNTYRHTHNEYMGMELLKILIQHKIDYRDISSLLHSLFTIPYDEQIIAKLIGKDGYQDIEIPELFGRNLSKYGNVMIVRAYRSDNQKLIDRVLNATENRASPSLEMLKFIAHDDHIGFASKYGNPDRRHDMDLDDMFGPYVLEMAGPKILDYVLKQTDPEVFAYYNFNTRLMKEPSFIEYILTKFNHDVHEVANLAFQLGYDGPCWQKINDKDLYIVNIFDPFIEERRFKYSPYVLKLEMLKRVFNACPPSKRELHILNQAVRSYRRYDIYMYICELLARMD